MRCPAACPSEKANKLEDRNAPRKKCLSSSRNTHVTRHPSCWCRTKCLPQRPDPSEGPLWGLLQSASPCGGRSLRKPIRQKQWLDNPSPASGSLRKDESMESASRRQRSNPLGVETRRDPSIDRISDMSVAFVTNPSG